MWFSRRSSLVSRLRLSSQSCVHVPIVVSPVEERRNHIRGAYSELVLWSIFFILSGPQIIPDIRGYGGYRGIQRDTAGYSGIQLDTIKIYSRAQVRDATPDTLHGAQCNVHAACAV